jgi:hypothetical protein
MRFMRDAALILLLGMLLLAGQAIPGEPVPLAETPVAELCVEADEDALSETSNGSPVAIHGDGDLGMALHVACALGRTARHSSHTAHPTPLRLCVLRC